jgi:iron complex outermembrane recepter protein
MNQQQQDFKKLIITMAQQFLLVLVCVTSIFGRPINAQDILNRPVTLELNNVELKQAIQQLERSAEVPFIFSSKLIQAQRKVSISAKNTRLALVLEEVLTPLHIKYKVMDDHILLNVAVDAPLSIAPKSVVTETSSNVAPPISGTVKDGEGSPLTGVSVVIKGTTKGAITDENGNFTLDVKAGDVLVFTFVGFDKQEFIVTNTTSKIDISMRESAGLVGEVTVIGSRGKPRTDVERAVPVDVISAKELQMTGQTDLGQMAQFTSPSFNSAKYGINGVANYADPATLRGMSPDQVLVLINGKRRHQFSALNLNVTVGKGTVVTDLNSLPSLAVDRLEILRDGAAAQYGSDAIAGIVNLNLNKSVGKGTFKTQFGQTKEGDGASYMGALNYGFKLGKENSYLNLTLHYQHADGTQRSDPFTGRIYVAAGATPATTLIREDSTRAARGVWPTTTSGKPFYVSTYGSNPTTAYQGFANLGYPLSKEWTLYGFGGYSQKNIAAEGFFRNAIPTDANSNVAIYPNGYDPDLPGTSVDFSGVAGVRKEVKDGWNIDLSTGYGKNYLDLWAKNTTNPSMGASSPTEFYVGRSGFGQSTTEASLTKNVEGWAGTKSLNMALGGQLRFDFFSQKQGDENSYKVGPLATTNAKAPGSSGRPGIAPEDALDITRRNVGIFADVESDITDKLLVATALRFENYSDFGNNLSGKLATRLKLTDNIAIRGSINKGFRAPSLQQINNSVTTSAVQAGAILQTKQLPSTDARLEKIGIAKPKAEDSWNYNVGLTAKVGEKLLFTADVYQIDIKNRIIISEALGVSGIAALKSNFTGLTQISFFTNHLNTRTQGLDLVATFKHSFNDDNRFTASVAGTFNKTIITSDKGTPDLLQAGTTAKVLIIDTVSRSLIETSQPREKILVSLGYQWKKFNLTVRGNYFGAVTAWEKPAGLPHRSQVFSAKTIYDVVLSFAATKNLSFAIGGNNVTDVYPDKVISTYASYFTGQTPYTRNANQFGFNGAFYYLNGTLNF